MTAEFKGGASVPIGQPMANLRCYVLDEHLQPVPTGVPGELMVSGIQLARGYMKRPDLTAEKFIANPFSDGDPHHGRLYRTGAGWTINVCMAHWLQRMLTDRSRAAGDLARWLPSGVIDFMGRLDNQACNISTFEVS